MAFQGYISDTKLEITGQKIYTEPPKHEWTCGNCKHWGEPWTNSEADRNKRATHADCEVLCKNIEFWHADYIAVSEDFGCINFERK